MSKPVILCVGDSLGMPREGVAFYDTWFYKIASKYPNCIFVNRFQRAFTSKMLNSKENLEYYNPSIVILQVGIVDCAPRYFKKNSLAPKIINRFPPGLKNRIWGLIKKKLKRKSSNSYVSSSDFSVNIQNYLKRCVDLNVEKIVIIKIQKPGSTMLEKSLEILKSIEQYNNILIKISQLHEKKIILIDPLKYAIDDWYINDGYHLNSKGFYKVFETLNESITFLDLIRLKE